MSKKQDTAIIEAPGLGAIEAIFPPTSVAVPVAANVSRKLPTFWPDALGDAQFAIWNGTVSKTKFYHAVAVIPQEVASQILDLILALPAGDPYSVLRKSLIMLHA